MDGGWEGCTVASPGLAKAVVRPASDGRTGRAVLAAPEDARAAGATHGSCRRLVTTKAVAHVPLSRRWCLLVLFLLLLLVWHCRRRRRWRRRRRRAASDSNLIGASSFIVFALVWRRRLVLSSNLLDELCGKRAFLEFSLCLSRACLGEKMTFTFKWLKKRARFLTWLDAGVLVQQRVDSRQEIRAVRGVERYQGGACGGDHLRRRRLVLLVVVIPVTAATAAAAPLRKGRRG